MDDNTMPSSSSAYPSQPGVPPPLSATPPFGRPPRRSNGWRIAAIILALLLLLSVLSHLGMFISGLLGGLHAPAYSRAHPLEEVTLESKNSAHKIVVISIEGLIFGGGMDRSGYGLVESLSDQLKRASRDSRVKAVLLKINSPGGEVLASDEISRAITDFQEQSGKPVIALMGSVAASGGYYVACACRWIVAHELTITGSVGVIMHNYNYRGLMNKIGLHPQVFKSGRFKDMLSGERDLENLDPMEKSTVAEEEQMIQRLIDNTFARFKSVVLQGRTNANRLNQKNSGAKGQALVENWEEYTDGRIWSGTEAHEHGFVDELGNWRTAVKRAQVLAGIPDADLVQYQRPFDFANLFRLFSQSSPPSLKLEVGVDWPKIQPGCLYYLAPTYLR